MQDKNTIRIPNWLLRECHAFLGQLSLGAYHSAVRMAFKAEIKDAFIKFNDGVEHIKEQFQPKDDTGNPIWARGKVVDGNVTPDPDGPEIEGYWTLSKEDAIRMNSAVEKLGNLPWVFESNNSATFDIIKLFFLNETIKHEVSGDMADLVWDIQKQLDIAEDIAL